MPSLHILKGANQGATVPLQKERFVIGRNPECDVVIPVTSVSREHAQLLRTQGRYHIEDLQSRNGTFVNNQAITARTVLKNNDRIRICDFLAVFLDNEPPTADDDGGQENSSTVCGSLSRKTARKSQMRMRSLFFRAVRAVMAWLLTNVPLRL